MTTRFDPAPHRGGHTERIMRFANAGELACADALSTEDQVLRKLGVTP
jgi:hypothetical protein